MPIKKNKVISDADFAGAMMVHNPMTKARKRIGRIGS